MGLVCVPQIENGTKVSRQRAAVTRGPEILTPATDLPGLQVVAVQQESHGENGDGDILAYDCRNMKVGEWSGSRVEMEESPHWLPPEKPL